MENRHVTPHSYNETPRTIEKVRNDSYVFSQGWISQHKMQQKRQATEKYTHSDISYIIIQDKKTHRHGCADKHSECKHLTITAVTSMWGQEVPAGRGSSYTAHCGGFKHSTGSCTIPSKGGSHFTFPGPSPVNRSWKGCTILTSFTQGKTGHYAVRSPTQHHREGHTVRNWGSYQQPHESSKDCSPRPHLDLDPEPRELTLGSELLPYPWHTDSM